VGAELISFTFRPVVRETNVPQGRWSFTSVLQTSAKRILWKWWPHWWAAVLNGVWRWKPGPRKFYPLPGAEGGSQGFEQDSDGALLVATNAGVFRLANGEPVPYPVPGTTETFPVRRILRDRDGGLWAGTRTRGTLHLHEGRADWFAETDGLSANCAKSFFEDREGNIWVATLSGLDRFRNYAVATFSGAAGLSNATVEAVIATAESMAWHGGQKQSVRNRVQGKGKVTDQHETSRASQQPARSSRFTQADKADNHA
jgi:ligand-binding sensor domain-containing protein